MKNEKEIINKLERRIPPIKRDKNKFVRELTDGELYALNIGKRVKISFAMIFFLSLYVYWPFIFFFNSFELGINLDRAIGVLVYAFFNEIIFSMGVAAIVYLVVYVLWRLDKKEEYNLYQEIKKRWKRKFL